MQRKKTIGISVDSNCGITPEEANQLGIHLVFMPFFIEENIHYEYEGFSTEEFFRLQKSGVEIRTSMPSPKDLMKVWSEMLQHYDHVIHIPMARGLSSSYESAAIFAEEFKGRVIVLKNDRISIAQRFCVHRALELIEDGKSVEDVVEVLEEENGDFRIFLAVDDLTYLKQGGRLSPTAAAIGQLLQIKPILKFEGEKIDAFAKARGMVQGKKKMLEAVEQVRRDLFAGSAVDIALAYAGDEALGQDWLKTAQQAFPKDTLLMDRLPLSIVAHTGPGTLGIGIMKRHKGS